MHPSDICSIVARKEAKGVDVLAGFLKMKKAGLNVELLFPALEAGGRQELVSAIRAKLQQCTQEVPPLTT